jgi:hypothetical protein
MTIRDAAVIASAGLAALALPLLTAAARRGAPRAPADRRTFTGTWSAAGTRESLPIDGGRTAAVVHLSGAIMLTGETSIGRGVQGEVIGFDNGAGLSAGCAVWTDAQGARIFSVITGDILQAGRRIVGTITGGTGRFAGATGGYELTWQYVVSTEGDGVQGRATDLRGWIRRDEGS